MKPNTIGICTVCDKELATHGVGKTKTVCRLCWNIAVNGKQQSIEEAAPRYAFETRQANQPSIEHAFIAGAKSQATEIERLTKALAAIRFEMYSRDTWEVVHKNISEILTNAGFPWEEGD